MTFFILQTLLLLAIAYILGCVLGCWLHRLFGAADEPAVIAPAAAAAAVAAPVIATAASAPALAAEPVGFTEVAAPAALVSAPKAKPAAKAKSAAKPAAKPKAAAAAKIVAPAKKDDLKRIRGIGRQNEARLNALGVATFAQIASWSRKDEENYGERLAFPGRIEREEWVKQAKILAKGGTTDFAKRVDRGEVETSLGKGTVGDMGSQPMGLIGKARGGKPDNLTLIDGVGNAIEKRLHELGLFHFDQIAALSDEEASWVGNQIGFPGRVQRENWIGEAKVFAAGGTTAHAKRVEAGEIPTSRKSTAAEKGRKK